ncbi:NUDIX hydrolase domain-like protein [Aspergillus coremiiformis]|uniref:NUDIX hydrolase domain-like protein n=1 Tax=Aspergillus coremiiformis TaxID=138285 RepID=A0A5N6Z582_9EURO|nr:NUDIX hydrolase domain-like protein [Aspergillus coremiiformis]
MPPTTTQVPRIGIGAFILNNEGKVLLGKRKGSHGAGTWALPGGHLEFNESFENCAEREILEETGLTIREVQFLTATNDIMVDENKHYVTVFVRGRISGERVEPKLMEPEKCEAWEWVAWDEIVAVAREVIDGKDTGNTSNLRRKLFVPIVNLVLQRPGFCPIVNHG